jgi:hypothetical protein
MGHLDRIHHDHPKIISLMTKEDKMVADSVKKVVQTLTSDDVIQNGASFKKSMNIQEVSTVVKVFQSKLYKAIVSMGAAARQIENTELRELLVYTAEMGGILNNKKQYMTVGRGKFNQLKYQSFCRSIMHTQCFIEYCRRYYQTKTNCSNTPFINVLHDVWSKDLSEVLGVSICCIDPTNFIYYKGAIGLQTIESHSSVYLIDKINTILGRMNIESSDIWRAVNDNANAAKFVGRIIASNRIPVNSQSTCIMHTGNLILEHALGLRPRLRSKEPDVYVEGAKMCKDVHTALSIIMNKRNKKIFEDYTKICKDTFQSKSVRFMLPNETRVSGKYIMIQSLLRQHRAFVHFTTDHASPHKTKFSAIRFEERDWIYIQEMEGIMSGMGVVTLGTQTDQPCYISYCWYQVQYVRSTAERGEGFSLMNLKKTWAPDTPLHMIPVEYRKRQDLLPESIIFLKRIVRECDFYLKEPDGDMRLSIFLTLLLPSYAYGKYYTVGSRFLPGFFVFMILSSLDILHPFSQSLMPYRSP